MDWTVFLNLGMGIVGTWLGAEFLVRGSVRLAMGLGIRPLLVGLTVVALGTSAPEAVVSFVAAARGAAGMSVGNVVGSNIANIGLILGIVCLLSPLRVNWPDIRRDALMMLLATVVASVAIAMQWLNRPMGILLLLLLVVTLVISARARHLPVEPKESVDGDLHDDRPAARRVRPSAVVMSLVGLVLLVFGARALVGSAETIARTFGISDAIIGATMVAVGTSLPELAASIVAVFRGHHELGIGNIVGSNMMNLLFVLGGVCVIQPIEAPQQAIDLLVPVMLVFTLAFLPMLATGAGVRRREGAVLLAGYLSFALFAYF